MNKKTESDIFSVNGLPPREQVTEWVNIKKNIGDKVHGIFMGWWEAPSTNAGFKDQLSVAIQTDDGTVIGISVADTPYMRSRLVPSAAGDRVGLKYEGDKDTGKPQPAKIVKFYNPDMEERRKKGEVKSSAPDNAAVQKGDVTLTDIEGDEEAF